MDDKGYTRISNQTLHFLCNEKLTLREIKILLFILRYTEGFNRKEASLSATYIANGTGMDRNNVMKTLTKLKEKNLISYKSSRNGNKPKKISLSGVILTTTCGVNSTPRVVVKSTPKKERKKGGISEPLPLGSDLPKERNTVIGIEEYRRLFTDE